MTSDQTHALMRRLWRTPALWIAALTLRIVVLVVSALGGLACLAAFVLGVDLTARYDLPVDVPTWVFLIPAIPLLLVAALQLRGLRAGVEMRWMHEAMQGYLPMPDLGSEAVEAHRSEGHDGFMEGVDSPAFLGPTGADAGAAAQRDASSPRTGAPGPVTAQISDAGAKSDAELFAAFAAEKGAHRWDEPTDAEVQRSRRAARRRREEAARREADRQRPALVTALLAVLRFVLAVLCALAVAVVCGYLAMSLQWEWVYPVMFFLSALTFFLIAKVDVRAAAEARHRRRDRRDEQR